MVFKTFRDNKFKNIVVATLVKGCVSHLIHFYMIVELNISKTGISARLILKTRITFP